MKMSRIALAMLVAAPFAAANAGVTVTPLMLGYHWYPENFDKQIGSWVGATNSTDVKDDLSVGAAIGAELTPWLQAEVEYQQTKPDVETPAGKFDGKHQTVSLNFIATSDVFTGNYDSKVKPYALIGGGWSKFEAKDLDVSTKDTIGNVGLGLLWQLNDALTLRTEARATNNFDLNTWDHQGIAALQVVLGGHLKPAAPVVEVEPVQPPVEVQPVEEPKEVTENLKMELRVFFDLNKSNIKPQYKPEIAKVAEKLVEYPNATAQIDGHTDNTGPRKLNERLSLARANSVKASLVNEFGIDANRLTTQGFAWDQPIADNSTAEGRAMNRRVFATITGSKTVVVQPGQQ
ncbi:OmpA family protein [Acinetobacter qingfengensis]|uniref:OmpA-like domain-containing protein n=1 Tax=Acinetobacter qingfengensis TaxID=1262585 RepID=A0A1E7RFF8_9GAMM|nr:OmpA family protein [Acinetobacter qingfengensis]KAA8732758.1 OmpA family protein [Acinetobacter qingfengensis]OEY98129.1 hypothetical protein BJI46_00995 [Acinetobacter qingfengensis]